MELEPFFLSLHTCYIVPLYLDTSQPLTATLSILPLIAKSHLVCTMASFNIDARYSAFNNVTGNQLNVSNTTINREFIFLSPAAPSLKLGWGLWTAKTMFDTLPYAEGASWDPNLVCLSGTRKLLIDDITKWIYSADESQTAQIFWLSDVAGAGKTAIAHTIAQYCDNHGLLGSAFFFDRNIPDRRTPHKLFSTIAWNLARLASSLADHISLVLEKDRSLASACQSRQFEQLILEPSLTYRIGRPVVIVIDALDEGYDLQTLKVLRDEVPKLPGNFRVVLTSRPLDDIVTDLSNASHVQRKSIDIHGDHNQRDISMYIHNRLHYISSRKRLAADWPGAERTNDFVARAEGLFVWVSIVSEYLRTVTYPDRKLSMLIYERNLSGMHAEAKMDALYADILSTCDWSDEDFLQGYHLLMGAILAVKSPLSSSALRSLHRNPVVDIDGILGPLRSLLIGSFDNDRPIEILHVSFRDFVTSRAQFSPIHQHLYVSEQMHSQRLAILCLRVLNEDLTSHTPGTGYLTQLTQDTKGIPSVDKLNISEVLWYACRFWTEHIIEIEGPDSEILLESLRKFLEGKLSLWLELLSTRYPFQTLSEVRKWLQVGAYKYLRERVLIYLKITFPTEGALIMTICDDEYARTLFNLSGRFKYMNRLEHALVAGQEAVDLYRQLAAERPAAFNPDLAESLNNLSIGLSDLGHREQALEVSREAMYLYRQLAAKRPAAFNADLAMSLNNLSVDLSGLGHREQALKAIREAADLYRQLAAERPAAFIADLAMSLSSFSNRLSDLGHREHALEAIWESVHLYRQFAAERPAAFNADLAMSLNNLSNHLSDLGHREKALEAIRESVDLRRQVAAERPAAFNADLAMSLGTFSNRLSDLGHREQALEAIRESVDLRRRLAAECPAAFNADLAMSLSSFSNRLSDLGHREQALEPIREAANLYRQIAAEQPATFNADLAMSLNNLSIRLSDLGHREQALEAIRESVDLRRHLAAKHPAAFNADLAMSLNNLSVDLSGLGHREQALEAIQGAADLYRQLAAERPAAFNADFAMSLNNLSDHLLGLGHHEQALDAIRESVDLQPQLAAERPAIFNAALKRSLRTLSQCMSTIGHQENMLQATQEAAVIEGQLAAL